MDNIKCILWGGYGKGNVGDEIILSYAIQDMMKEFPNQFAVLSREPQYTQWLFPEVKVLTFANVTFPIWYRFLARYNKFLPEFDKSNYYKKALYSSLSNKKSQQQPDWVNQVAACEQLFLVGGGYLSDLFNLHKMMLPVLVAKFYDKQITSAPIGIGPFLKRSAEKLVVDAFRDAELYVRDRVSLDFCHKHEIKADFQIDDGYRLVTEKQNFLHLKSCSDEEKKYVLGFSLSYQKGSEFTRTESIEWWVELIQLIIKRKYFDKIEGFCFHNNVAADFYYLIEMFSKCGLPVKSVIPPFTDFRRAVQKLNSYNIIITTRYHAAVMAEVYKIPHVVLYSGSYYETKMVNGLFSDRKTGRCVSMDKFAPSSMIEIIEGLINETNSLSNMNLKK